MRRLILCVLTVGFMLAACVQDGDYVEPPNPEKRPPKLRDPVRVALYVDTVNPAVAAQELQAAVRYSIKMPNNGRKVAYFDYVILGGGLMMDGSVSAYIELTPGLKSILADYNGLVKPLRDRGIKVLLGISGGHDGISFGCLPGNWENGKGPSDETELTESEEKIYGNIARIFKERIKNEETYGQRAFARKVVDAVKYYRLDGIEFWDKDGGDGQGRNPYPTIGEPFFDGDQSITIEADDEKKEPKLVYRWIRGGGNFTDMLKYINEEFGADVTFQGEGDFEAKYRNPVLVRETGYGKWLSIEVPRYNFSNTMMAMTYLVGNRVADEDAVENAAEYEYEYANTDDEYGRPNFKVKLISDGDGNPILDDSGNPILVEKGKFVFGWPFNTVLNRGENEGPREILDWVKDGLLYAYSPVIIDVGNISAEDLERYSQKLGWRVSARGTVSRYLSRYGLVYYSNLGPYSAEQKDKLSVTSIEVFTAEVEYD